MSNPDLLCVCRLCAVKRNTGKEAAVLHTLHSRGSSEAGWSYYNHQLVVAVVSVNTLAMQTHYRVPLMPLRGKVGSPATIPIIASLTLGNYIWAFPSSICNSWFEFLVPMRLVWPTIQSHRLSFPLYQKYGTNDLLSPARFALPYIFNTYVCALQWFSLGFMPWFFIRLTEGMALFHQDSEWC